MPDRSRRALLAGLAVPAAGALAGCGGLLGGTDAPTPTPEPLTRLRGRPIYVDPALSLSVPDVAEPVDSPDNAEVVVIPADTDRSNSAIVHWLAADRYVALVGDDAEPTWLDVKESDAYAAMLGEPRARSTSCGGSGSGSGGSSGGGSGDAAPTDCERPDMVVAWTHPEVPTTTFRSTWTGTDDPSSRRVFEGIDEALDDD